MFEGKLQVELKIFHLRQVNGELISREFEDRQGFVVDDQGVILI